jgi:hypothetical protein
MSGQVFKLEYPFTFKGEEHKEFTLRRPKVRDFRNFAANFERNPTTAMEKAISDLCEIDTLVIAEIDIEDYGPMKLWFEGFLERLSKKSED